MVAGSSALASELRSSTVGVGDVLPERAQLLHAAGVDLPDVLERGQPRRAPTRRRPSWPSSSTMHGGGARVAEDPLDLLRRAGLVHRHGDRARAPDREVEQRPLVAGTGHQGDPGYCGGNRLHRQLPRARDVLEQAHALACVIDNAHPHGPGHRLHLDQTHRGAPCFTLGRFCYFRSPSMPKGSEADE